MNKTEVYSWRLEADLKTALEEIARAQNTSIAQLLDRIVGDWLSREVGQDDQEQEFQQKLQAAAARSFGAIHGGDPHRAEQARQRIRSRLKNRRAG